MTRNLSPSKPMIINIKDCKTILELRIITDLVIKIPPVPEYQKNC